MLPPSAKNEAFTELPSVEPIPQGVVPSDAVRGLAEDAESYRMLLQAIDVGFCIIEMLFDAQGNPTDYLFLETNAAFERHTGLVDATGKTARQLVPTLDTFWFHAYGEVALTGEPRRFENHAPSMSRWFDVYAMRVGAPEMRHVGVIFTDITARKLSQEALRHSEEQLQNAQARLEAALAASDIATWTIDLVNDRVTGDAYLAYLFSVDPQAVAAGTEPLQTYFNAVHEEDRAYAIRATTAAMRNGAPYAVVVRVVLRDGSLRWISSRGKIVRDAAGTPLSLIGAIIDITEREQAIHRLRLLFESQVVGVIFWNLDSGQITDANDHFLSVVGYSRDDLMAGQLNFRAMTPPEWTRRNEEGVSEIRRSGSATAYEKEYFRKDGSRVPILIGGTRFHDSEAEGFSYIIDISDRKKLEREQERLLMETQARAEREALLNRIGAAVRSTLEPDAIVRATVSTLGQGLGVDRCYFVRYNQTRDTARVFPEWIRDGLSIRPLEGHSWQMSTFAVDRDAAYKTGRTQAVDDVVAYAPGESATLTAVDIRALLRVPIEVGEQMTALALSMAFTPRRWTDEDVRLVENVATLLHSVLESALSQQRERNIAQQLQEALQPATPSGLPGLALASYYRPALAEASVGGDFYDVFPIEEGRTALVVADLSGKGLAAASQVSTVRNMLRCVLYDDMPIAEAVTGLHRKLVKRELLTGFATLFVGVYDERKHTFTYVNCGQDAALIFRKDTGIVEQLRSTGPVLGGFGDGNFQEKGVLLSEGDVIAIFTDGLTEVGPTRKTLLAVEGVSDLLRVCCEELAGTTGLVTDPQAVLDRLIAGVDAFARGGVRDDIALLIGVMTA